MENVFANGWSGAVPSRARRKTASPVARSLLTLFFLVTQSDQVEVCGGQGLCTALSYVALGGSECMIGDVMRIQRTPRSMPAVFSPCIQTQGPRLYKERVAAVRKTRFLGVKWFGNATAVSSHDSLLVSNGDCPLEFNWWVLVKLPRLFFRFGFRRCAKHACQLFLLYSLVCWRSHPSCCRARKPRFWVSTHDSLLVPNGDYALEFNSIGASSTVFIIAPILWTTTSFSYVFSPCIQTLGLLFFYEELVIVVQRDTEFACQQVCMMKELTTLGPSEMEILVGVPRRVSPHCWRHTSRCAEVCQFFQQINDRNASGVRRTTRNEMKWCLFSYVTSYEREVCLGSDDHSPPPWWAEGWEHSSFMCKDNTSKDPLSQCESLQGIHVQVRNWIKWYSDTLNWRHEV